MSITLDELREDMYAFATEYPRSPDALDRALAKYPDQAASIHQLASELREEPRPDFDPSGGPSAPSPAIDRAFS